MHPHGLYSIHNATNDVPRHPHGLYSIHNATNDVPREPNTYHISRDILICTLNIHIQQSHTSIATVLNSDGD